MGSQSDELKDRSARANICSMALPAVLRTVPQMTYAEQGPFNVSAKKELVCSGVPAEHRVETMNSGARQLHVIPVWGQVT